MSGIGKQREGTGEYTHGELNDDQRGIEADAPRERVRGRSAMIGVAMMMSVPMRVAVRVVVRVGTVMMMPVVIVTVRVVRHPSIAPRKGSAACRRKSGRDSTGARVAAALPYVCGNAA